MADAIERGRNAFDRQAWGSARRELSGASERGQLDVGDLERLAVVAYLVGEDEESERAWADAYHEHLRQKAPGEAARCAFWLAFGLLLRGETARASGWLGRAQRIIEDADLDCVARGYLLVPSFLQALGSGDAGMAYDLATDANEIGRRFDDPDLVALGTLSQGQASIASGETSRGARMLDEAMVAVTSGEVSPIPAGIVYCAVIEACLRSFDLRRAGEWTEALSRWCDSQPDLVPYRGQCLVHRSQILQAHGEWREALTEAERARERLARPPHPALGDAWYQEAELFRLRGEFEEAEAAYRRASAHGHEPAPGLALLHLAEGRVEDAATVIRRAVDEIDDVAARPALLASEVEIMRDAADLATARSAADELTEVARQVGSPLLRAVAAHAFGSVLLAEGDPSRALGELRQASEHWRALDMPYEAARTRVLVGLSCAALGDRATAELKLDAARGVFASLGATPDLTRLDELLGGAETAPSAPLTDRECEVLRLVAAGKMNRDIASELVISEHTVARHLQNIFTKIDVSSRAAATATPTSTASSEATGRVVRTDHTTGRRNGRSGRCCSGSPLRTVCSTTRRRQP